MNDEVDKIYTKFQGDANWSSELNLNGPLTIEVISILFGSLIVLTSLLDLADWKGVIASPSSYTVCIYQVFFAICGILGEVEFRKVKIFTPAQTWIYQWFPFLKVSLGKGCLYIFVGLQCLLLSRNRIFHLALGAAMQVLGMYRVLYHFKLKRKLKDKGWELTQTGVIFRGVPPHPYGEFPSEYVHGIESYLHKKNFVESRLDRFI